MKARENVMLPPSVNINFVTLDLQSPKTVQGNHGCGNYH